MNRVVMRKNIYAVCITHTAGFDLDKKKIAKHKIRIGDKFALTDIVIGNFDTRVEISLDPPNWFNSVFFKFLDGAGREYDIYHDRELLSRY